MILDVRECASRWLVSHHLPDKRVSVRAEAQLELVPRSLAFIHVRVCRLQAEVVLTDTRIASEGYFHSAGDSVR